MRLPIAIATLLSLAAGLGAPRAPGDDAAAQSARAADLARAALSHGGAWTKLCELVAAAPHRLSGSPGAAAAVEWARHAMERDGLENVRLEPCMVPHWERGAPEVLRFAAPAGLAGERLAVLALGGSVATPPGGITAEVVAVAGIAALDALGPALHGRIVLFDGPLDPGLLDPFEAYDSAVSQRVLGPAEAGRRGAVAALVRSMTTRLDDTPHTGAMRYADDAPRIPAAAVSTLGAQRIAALLARGERVELHLELDCRQHADAPSFNVVGELVGRERPDEIVVVGAHLDAWDVGQGAHDDGGGCAQAIEVARLLRALDLRPLRTVRVVLFMNEENGLAGARAYHRDHADELERHVLAIESDRGGFTPRGFVFAGGARATAIVEELAAALAAIGAERVVAGEGGSDIAPLGRSGVPTMGLMPDGQRYFDLHHSSRDTLSEVSPRELELGAAAMAAMVFAIADREERLPRAED